MRISLSSMLGLALVLWPIANAQAAELQVLAGAGIAAPWRRSSATWCRRPAPRSSNPGH